MKRKLNEKRKLRLVNADGHILEPPDLWTSRLPKKFQDIAPRQKRFEQGDAWVLDGVKDPITFGLNASAGKPPEQQKVWMRWEDLPPGAYDPKARLVEQDRDLVDAEVLYPTPRLSHSYLTHANDAFHAACIQAYNDWLAEYCAASPGRLCGLAQLPLRGPKGAVAEMDRMMARPGIYGVNISGWPNGSDEITDADDAFFEAAAARNVPISIHVMFATSPTVHRTKLPGDVRFYDVPTRMIQLIFSGVLDRYPNLKIVFAETDCGWIPYLKEQLDDRFNRLRLSGTFKLEMMPSEYMNRHFYHVYITDSFGVKNRHAVGVDNMMWSNDYPHVGADFPNSWRTIAASFAGVAIEERDKILAGNAASVYGLG